MFLDGNIVLIAKKTVAFRVYKGILSLRSETFRDMFSLPNVTAAAFDILASLIRMAHKYMVQDVLDEALSRLKKYYPSDLSAWQNPSSPARYVKARKEHAPTAIALARLDDTLSLLPTAYLTCVDLSTDCRVKPDGTCHYPAAQLSFLDLSSVRVIASKGHLTQACATPQVCGAAQEERLAAFREDGRRAPISDNDAFEPIPERLWGEPH